MKVTQCKSCWKVRLYPKRSGLTTFEKLYWHVFLTIIISSSPDVASIIGMWVKITKFSNHLMPLERMMKGLSLKSKAAYYTPIPLSSENIKCGMIITPRSTFIFLKWKFKSWKAMLTHHNAMRVCYVEFSIIKRFMSNTFLIIMIVHINVFICT